ncbi:MAG: hypothetical protein R2731_05145 [Nocardioides sp.]
MTTARPRRTPRPPSRVLTLGTLSDHAWPGQLSARHSGLDTRAVLETLDAYYVAVDSRAKTRCIDGRHDPGLDETLLGPQVPGGAPGSALAYRLGVDKDDLTRGTFTGDAEMMIESYLRPGLAPGGHRDDLTSGDEHVGCGAIDASAPGAGVHDRPRPGRGSLPAGPHHPRHRVQPRPLPARARGGAELKSRSTAYFAGRGET